MKKQMQITPSQNAAAPPADTHNKQNNGQNDDGTDDMNSSDHAEGNGDPTANEENADLAIAYDTKITANENLLTTAHGATTTSILQ